MNGRRVAFLLGVLALGLGLTTAVAPGLVGVSLDGVFVTVIGVLALVQALNVIQARWDGDLVEAETPDPELPASVEPPGEDVRTGLRHFLDRRRIHGNPNRVRSGLRAAAVAVLSRYRGLSDAEAEDRVERGLWTDDRHAAAFVGGDAAPSPPARARLRSLVRGSSLQRRIRHTVDGIAAVAGVSPRSGDDAAGDSAAPEDGPTRFSTPTGPEFDEADAVVTRSRHGTGHWRGVSVVTFVAIGVGILAEQPAVVLAGVVGVGFAAYARSSALPPGLVSVERTVDDRQPEAGDDVEVAVTVTNESDRLLPDLRVVDGVPEALAVADGSPRCGTALRAGESIAFSYTVTARRGVHSFNPAVVVARDLTGASEQKLACEDATTLECTPPLRPVSEPVPLREQAARYVGRMDTSTGGAGVEFYATREYERGDPVNRIDWNHRARTGEFTTVEFREERAARVVVVVDAREDAYVAPDAGAEHAVDRAVDAAGRLFASLSAAGDHVGIAAVGSESCWLAPNAGVAHRTAARELLASHPGLAPAPQTNQVVLRRWRRQFRKRLSPGTQLLFVTPLCDPQAARFARRFDESGFPVTVVSPDATADRTPSHRLTRVARTLQVSVLRSAGIPVVDWSWDETVDEALARYGERGGP